MEERDIEEKMDMIWYDMKEWIDLNNIIFNFFF